MSRRPLHIALYVGEGMQLLDFAGPYAAFEAANAFRAGAYALTAVGLNSRAVVVEGGLSILPRARVASVKTVDTLIIPGGAGIRLTALSDTDAGALHALARRARRVVGVCTGAFLIAQLGLADGKTVATHWRHADELAGAHPAVTVDGRSLFVRDGDLWTSAGITAGIHLALALIREDYGAPAAAAVARELVVYLQRPGDQMQFATPLAAQSARPGVFADLIEWMGANLSGDLSVEGLAARAKMSPRSFARHFRNATGAPPAQFVESLRLDVARQILAQGAATVESVAATVGYASADGFRRAFERAYGVPPSFYRETFGTCCV
ncbi:MAG: GlxA family transcriptional regulator [Hyphococcus sp.]